MDVEIVPIDSVFQDPENARIHSEDQIQKISKSLSVFDQQKPIVVSKKDNIIIAGNGTHEAAKLLEWEEIGVIWSSLSVKQARAYGIADNEIAEGSNWDFHLLSKQVKDIEQWNPTIDWGSIGFDNETVSPLLEHALQDDAGELSDYDKSDPPSMAKSIKVTHEMRQVIDQAIQLVRLGTNDPDMTEGRALELISADYLSGR